MDLTLFAAFIAVSGTEKAAEKLAEKPAMSEALMVIDSDSDNEKSKALRSPASVLEKILWLQSVEGQDCLPQSDFDIFAGTRATKGANASSSGEANHSSDCCGSSGSGRKAGSVAAARSTEAAVVSCVEVINTIQYSS